MRSKISFLALLYAFTLFGHTNTTIVSRLKLAHPDLGYDGGASLYTAVNSLYVKIGDNMSSRYSEYTGVANSGVNTIDHNFGVAFSELRVLLYTGTGTSKVRVPSPSASGWTIAATTGFLTTKIDVTAPSSGGPFTFSVEILQENIKLADLIDVDVTTSSPQDGQALVYDGTQSKWLPGASGDASFKCQAVSTPNLTLKSGYLILGDSSEIQLATDLSLNLTTVLGSTPANATAYYLYLDRDALPAATTLSTGRVVKVASTASHFSVQTALPTAVQLSRYVPLCVIKSATTGNAWSGTGSSFSTLATRRHDRPLLNVSPTVYSLTQQAVGSIGSSGQIAAGHVLTSASFPTFTTQVSFFNLAADGSDGSSNARTLTNNGTVPFTGTNILGSTNAASAYVTASSQFFNSTASFFNPGAVDFSSGGWFAATSWVPATLMVMIANNPSTTDRGWVAYINTDGTINLDYNTSATTVGTITIPAPGFSAGSWHHIAVKYINATKTWGLYIDGQLASASNSAAANRTITSTNFRIGAGFTATPFYYTGKAEDAFFTTLSLKDEDIRRLYSYRVTHSSNVAVANQQWDASFIGNLSNKLGNSWLVHMDANTVYWDFSDLGSTDQVQPTMANKSFQTTNVPVRTFTTGKLSASPSFPLSHGLGARPKDFYVLTTASSIAASDDKRYDLCSATDTTITCDFSSLTIDSSHQVEIVASAAPVAIAVGDASSTSSGIVNTGAQTFAGAKTLTQTDVNGFQVAGMRNRIINGSMEIDQRFVGGVISDPANNTYTVDRWTIGRVTAGKINVQQNADALTPPAGLKNYVAAKVTATQSLGVGDIWLFGQAIEGYNIVDFGSGTANNKTFTLSFWVYSSVTGTFTGSVKNTSTLVTRRNYSFAYTINAINTWEYKTITILADGTGGTGFWLNDSGVGMYLSLVLAAGSTFLTTANTWGSTYFEGATGQTNTLFNTVGNIFAITGVQIELGAQATPFERRTFGAELLLAQRYFEKSYDQVTLPGASSGTTLGAWFLASDSASAIGNNTYKATKRVTPSVQIYSPSGVANNCRNNTTSTAAQAMTVTEGNQNGLNRLSGTLTTGHQFNCHYTANAEL